MFVDPNKVAFTADAVESNAAIAINLKPACPSDGLAATARAESPSPLQDVQRHIGHNAAGDEHVDTLTIATLP